MSDSEENNGKQAKDLADAAETSVEAVKNLARFLDGAFGNIVSNSVGLLSDKLAYYRLAKAIALQETVDAKLHERGVKKKYIPVKFGLPIIENATVEEDNVLQEKWVNLLTNALDATYERPMRRNFSTILADLEPIDAKILDMTVKEYLSFSGDKSAVLFELKKLINITKLSPAVIENAVRNLMRLGLVKPGVISGAAKIGDHSISSYKDTEMFGLTGLGVDFFYAVNDPISQT